jgi:hypothetical protein
MYMPWTLDLCIIVNVIEQSRPLSLLDCAWDAAAQPNPIEPTWRSPPATLLHTVHRSQSVCEIRGTCPLLIWVSLPDARGMLWLL